MSINNFIKELKFFSVFDFGKARKYWILSIFLVFLWTSLESAFLYLFRIIIDFNAEHISNSLLTIVLIILGLYSVVEICMRITNILIIKLIPTHVYNIQRKLVKNLLGVSINFHRADDSSSTAAKVVHIGNIIEKFLKLILYSISATSFGFIASVLIISFSSKILGLYFLLWLCGMALATTIMVKKIAQLSLGHAVKYNNLVGSLKDILQNYLVVKNSAKEKYELAKYSNLISSQIVSKRKLEWALFETDLYRGFISLIFFSSLVYYSLNLLLESKITAGEIFFIISSAMIFRKDIWGISLHFIELYQDYGFIIEINNLKRQCIINKYTQTDSKKTELIKTIKLDNVTVNNKKFAILDTINLEIQQGEKVAIIGPSGSGKTTLAKLIIGLIDPDKGTMRVNLGSDFPDDQPAGRVLYIPQEPILFNRSIKENIVYGKKVNLPKLYEVLEKCMCDFIQNSKDLEGQVQNLSSGQKQRILIARALYQDINWLILDEPTAYLDPITERKLIINILGSKEVETLIIISHNPAILKMMQRIIVIEGGSVTGDSKVGNLSRNNFYKNFISL
jgi:ABC-type bacteriocin/lantibiotic exporter with double-glycine peptidase domain